MDAVTQTTRCFRSSGCNIIIIYGHGEKENLIENTNTKN